MCAFMRKGFSMRSSKVHWLLAFVSICNVSYAFSASELRLNRYAYDAIQQGFNQKNISIYDKKRASIDSYSLAAYTDYRAFLFDLPNKTPEQVNQFSQDYADYPFSVSIRADYLNAMIASKNWEALLRYQTTPPRDQDYQCYYYTAFYHQGKQEIAFEGARSLWLNGESVSNACNDLFSYWEKAGLRTDDVIKRRALLSIEERNPRLITYLIKLVSNKQSRVDLNEMYGLYQTPTKITTVFDKKVETPFNREYAQVMLRHLARKDTDKAYLAFRFINDHYSYTKDELQTTSEFLAVRLFQTTDSETIEWRDDVFKRSNRDEVLEQRIRLSIRKTQWENINFWILRLSDKAQSTYRWQYWMARSEIALEKVNEGEERLKRILGYRHIYSFAAAIALNREITYPIASVDTKFEKIAQYHPDLERVKELLALGKGAAAKSQWRYLIARASYEDRARLATYARNEGWDEFSLESTFRGGLWDHIELRFPVRYYSLFTRYGGKYKVNPITLMSLTRQESGFNPNAHSPVGALGLMQVLPSTASYMATLYTLPYKNRSDLFIAEKNIAIGSRYLSRLIRHYNNNRILAFAAYNAGPTMVAEWRRLASEELDTIGFIESISFKETRTYVKNILMFEEYYRRILNVDGVFLLTPLERTANY